MGVRHTETSLIVWSQRPSNDSAAAAPAIQADKAATSLFEADFHYDAGDKGCAAGPMDDIAALVRSRLATGQTLEIYATDPAVAVDLAAWCRMTGNLLEQQRGSHYLIRKG